MPPPQIPFGIPPGTMASGAARSLGFVAAAVPVDHNGVSLIPELVNRAPTHNESELILGEEIHLGSSNVGSMKWAWREPGRMQPALYLTFLDGSRYVYHDCSLTVAVGMVMTASPGRYVWNTLRPGWPTSTGAAQRLSGPTGRRRQRQVVRLIP